MFGKRMPPPWRIKMVEPIAMISREEQEDCWKSRL